MTVVSVDDAMSHLNMTDVDEYELGGMIDAAEAAISERVGPLEATTISCRVTGRGAELTLPVTPVVSVTSITPVSGVAMDLANVFVADGDYGVISAAVPTWHASRYSTFPYAAYDVVYVAGRDSCPADLVMAVKEMVRHLWKSQRGAAARPGSADSAPPAGYLIPNAVAELLEPHMQIALA